MNASGHGHGGDGVPTSIFYFGDFRLDTARRELIKGAELIDLPSSSFDCLVYLLQHRERAVGRDELISAVWGRADISDNLLSQTLVRVRRALGEAASDRSSIRTVTKFGYRWVAPTRAESEVATAASSASAAAAAKAATASSAPPAQRSVAADAVEPADNGAPHEATASADETLRAGAHIVQATAGSKPELPRRRAARGLIGAIALGTAVFLLLRQFAPAPATRDLVLATPNAGGVKPPALVLPVEVRAGAEWEWLRFGLMDLLANRLREGGVMTMDSESLYALLGANPDIARARPGAELSLPSLSNQRIYAAVWLQNQQWQVRITSIDATRRVEANGHGDDITAAARLAADNLLVALGHAPPSFANVSSNVQELLERTQVALLTNHPDQARELIARAPPALRDDLQVQVRQAEIDIRLGRLDAVRARLQPLLPQLERPGVELVRARALNALAFVSALGSAPRDATPLLDEAAHLAQQFNSAADLGRTLEVRATQELALGNPEQGLAHLAKARLLFETIGDPMRIAGTDLRAGGAAGNLSRYNEAISYLTRAEGTFQAFGARDQLAFARALHVSAKLALLDAPGALELSGAYWPPEPHVNNDRTRFFLMLTRALALSHNGRLSEAETLFARIRDTAQGELHAPARRNATVCSAEIAVLRANYAAALALAMPIAHEDAVDEDGATARYTAWHLAIKALRHSGDGAKASAETTQFNAWAASLGAPGAAISAAVLRDARFYAALDRADDDDAAGKLDAALPAYAELLAQARELQIPERVVQVSASYVPALLAAGRLDQAGAVSGGIGLWVDSDLDAAWTQAQMYRALGEDAAFHNALEHMRKLAGERVLPPVDGG